MDPEEILMHNEVTSETGDVKDKREQLMSLALTGKTKAYLNEKLTPDQVKSMSETDILKKYDLYLSSLGSKLTKSLSQSMINLYSRAINYFFPGTKENDLSYDLTKNPVVSDMLSSISANLYLKFGVLLSPVIIGVITMSHIKLQEEEEKENEDT
jgi:ABC-type dipeptide/oligopeptide/nickel transport system permease component